MKKLVVLIGVLCFCSISFAQDINSNYVVTKTDTVFCKKVVEGIFNTKCIYSYGESIKIPNNEINQYKSNDVFKKRLPLFIDGKQSDEYKMMKLVSFKDGVQIYKCVCYNGVKDCEDAFFNFYVKGNCVASCKNPKMSEYNTLLAESKKISDNDDTEINWVAK